MQSIFDTLCGFILVLLGFLVTAIAIVEGMARSVLGAIGVHGTPQTVLLFVLLIALVFLSFRLFGRLFAVLLAAAGGFEKLSGFGVLCVIPSLLR